jgi:hypothetical protein
MTPRVLQLLGLCLAGLAACTDANDAIAPTLLQQSSTGSSATSAGFTYDVTTKLADAPAGPDPLLRPTITASAKIRNDRTESVTLDYGACNVSLAAYATAERRGAPVWQSFASEPWEGTYGRGCIAIAIQSTLAPGAELSLGSYSSRVIEILGDSLPNGHYWFAATVAVGSGPKGITLPAGDFDLTLARPALPDSLTHELITYRAASTLVGGAVQGKVTATLTHAGGSIVEYPRECPVQLVAFRARDRRDAGPRAGEPDWRGSRPCATGWTQVALDRGQSASFEASAPAREILGNNLPDGTYHFALIVHTRTRYVWLSAGSAELRR